MKANPSTSIIEEKPRPTSVDHNFCGSFLSQFVIIPFSKLLKFPLGPPKPGQSSEKASVVKILRVKKRVIIFSIFYSVYVNRGN